MEGKNVFILSINRKTDNIAFHLKSIYSEILGQFSIHRSDMVISINNDDWLWLLDHWASFYLTGTHKQTKELSLFEKLLVWLRIKSPPVETSYPYSVDTNYLKKFRNEMSDGKYLFVSGYKVPVKVV